VAIDIEQRALFGIAELEAIAAAIDHQRRGIWAASAAVLLVEGDFSWFAAEFVSVATALFRMGGVAQPVKLLSR
jgi:hypothetical protein